MPATRPRIGVAPCFFHADPARPIFKGKTLLYLEESLSHWLMREGALPLLLPTAAAPLTVRELLQEVDAVVLQGGADVCPASYGETPLRPEWCGDRVRDEYEIALVRACLELDKPLLGVCRGLQTINVALGGTLCQDIATQRPECAPHRDWEAYDALRHPLRLEPDSWLARLHPGAEAWVNSVHHQCVERLGAGLRVEARAPDGTVEAVRYAPREPDAEPASAAPFVYAVQWHPEFHDPADASLLSGRPLVRMLLQAVEARATPTRALEEGVWLAG